MDKVKDQYHMRQEIGEQPEIFRRLLEKYVINSQVVEREFSAQWEQLKKIERITFIGCGSSFHAGLYGNYIFEEITGLPCEYEFAHEFVDRSPVVEFGTAFIFLSQSGRTKDTLAAARYARQLGSFVISITNQAGSELAALSHIHFYSEAGEEKAVAATKSFTASILLEVVLALLVARAQNVGGELAAGLLKNLRSLPDKAQQLFALEDEISRTAIRIRDKNHLLVLGRKFNYSIALEGAHKIKETSYLDAEAYASEEFMHGPNAIIEPGWPVFILLPKDSVSERNLSVAEELLKMQADIVVITNMEKYCLDKTSCWQIPAANEILVPILNAIVLQLLAFHLGVARGTNIDDPRNIKKFIG